MFDKLFKAADTLQTGLEASWLRNAVIRNNLANAETPGFKASSVEFESVLASAVNQALDTGLMENKRTRAQHINFNADALEPVQARVVTNTDLSMRMDENNVDIESENTKLAQNSIQYNTLMYKLNSELTRIKLAVTEGK